MAAFANGIFLHCLDYEIQGQPVAHGTSNILPSALALLDAGLVATVNSDDPAYFGGYINQNFLETFAALGLDAAAIGDMPPLDELTAGLDEMMK